ncbi:MAG: selenocysteine-specific translation elongation factor, partial [Candidatus Latescibacteria bacterium]|nr:selenocysteine-specific translation elongation factor [Candidatus Latescibacterota bacterium]
MSHVIIGTAGHIDHGKTALVQALTGIDTDTLPEERERGVTIDIGFAYWKDNVTIIDVPGHERFVKNMVTGVCSVDLALFVVAADDGAMPQTREHLGILNLLGVQRGIVALNKVDLADAEWTDLVREDLEGLFAGTFLAGAPIVPVSSVTGEGIDELRALIEAEIEDVQMRPDRGIFRLPVDRAFSVRGFGTIVTGTVLSGRVRPRDEVALLPEGRTLRVRGIQIHGGDVEVAEVGARAAVNLTGVEVEEVERGDILAQPGYFSTTYMIDARLNLLPDAPIPLRNRARVHLHLGPGEVLARVILLEADELHPGGSQLVQFRLESPGVAARGDRFVIRRYSPVHTLGGGIVLDAQPAKHRRHREEVHENLRGLEQDDPTRVLAHRLASAGFQAKTPRELASEMGLAPEDVESRLRELIDAGDAVAVPQAGQELYVGAEIWQDLLRRTQDALSAFHSSHPLQAGIRPNELRLQVAG